MQNVIRDSVTIGKCYTKRKKSFKRLPVKVLFIQNVQNRQNYKSTKYTRGLCGIGQRGQPTGMMFGGWVIKCSKLILLTVSHCHK